MKQAHDTDEHSSHPCGPRESTWPLVRELEIGSDLSTVFDRFRHLPNRVWLDSASDHDFDRGRYSFLTADPIAFCNASVDSPDPWPVLRQWCQSLQKCRDQQVGMTSPLNSDHSIVTELPPFWGGVVGLIAYEAAWYLEPKLRNPSFENPGDIPGMAIGVYDWTIAVDHACDKVWLISTGLDEMFRIDSERAEQRADQVLNVLGDPGDTEKHRSDPQEGSAKVGGTEASVFPTRVPEICSNFTDESFAAAVADVISRICLGDSFQVNLAQTLSSVAACDAATLYQHLRRINPAPYGGFFDAGQYQIASSSPEGFLQVRVNSCRQCEVVTRPIKGTVARTGDTSQDEQLGAELLASEKDRAENIMIVDLMRNDLSRVCEDASVRVTGLCELEKYQRVQHLVSTVVGTLRSDAGVADLLAACFPGGSITGAPKVEAMRTIAALERRPRGAYCGSMGYVSLSGDADFNILIRTITHRVDPATGPVWEFPVGGGITARSEPPRETEETWVKAASLLEAIAAAR